MFAYKYVCVFAYIHLQASVGNLVKLTAGVDVTLDEVCAITQQHTTCRTQPIHSTTSTRLELSTSEHRYITSL
jgi:hypothetical protein